MNLHCLLGFDVPIVSITGGNADHTIDSSLALLPNSSKFNHISVLSTEIPFAWVESGHEAFEWFLMCKLKEFRQLFGATKS